MRLLLVLLILIVGACTLPENGEPGACVHPRTRTDAVVRLWDLRLVMHPTLGKVIGGPRGSAWFISDTHIVTVEHVAQLLLLSSHEWRSIAVGQQRLGDERFSIHHMPMRVAQVYHDDLAEPIFVLEMQRKLPWKVRTLRARTRPLEDREPTSGIGYTRGILNVGVGHYYERIPGWAKDDLHDERYASFVMTDGTKLRALDSGASGGPILDCMGEVVGALSATSIPANGTPPNTTKALYATRVHTIAQDLFR